MKSRICYFVAVWAMAVTLSCSEEEEPRKGDPDIAHQGVKWKVVSVDNYVLSEVKMTGVVNKTGSQADAGFFYFKEDEHVGSFEMTIAGYNKEDAFAFTKDDDGSISIVSVEVSAGIPTNQNILVISGAQTSDTEIVLDAVSIVKESTETGIFTLTATSIKLVKE